MDLASDFIFAAECYGRDGEFQSKAALLRYVAAINPEATIAEFVVAAGEAGYKANSAANRFRESRKFNLENGIKMVEFIELYEVVELEVIEITIFGVR